jgi:hypothetical protein
VKCFSEEKRKKGGKKRTSKYDRKKLGNRKDSFLNKIYSF